MPSRRVWPEVWEYRILHSSLNMPDSKIQIAPDRPEEMPTQVPAEPAESIELGGAGYRLTDASCPQPEAPGPRGLLPVPPGVEEVVRAEESRLHEHGLVPGAEARRRLMDEHCLDHFFRDEWVSYRETPRGVDVLAVGLDEIGRLMKSLDPEALPTVRTRQV